MKSTIKIGDEFFYVGEDFEKTTVVAMYDIDGRHFIVTSDDDGGWTEEYFLECHKKTLNDARLALAKKESDRILYAKKIFEMEVKLMKEIKNFFEKHDTHYYTMGDVMGEDRYARDFNNLRSKMPMLQIPFEFFDYITNKSCWARESRDKLLELCGIEKEKRFIKD
jgi:hypothetical protein